MTNSSVNKLDSSNSDNGSSNNYIHNLIFLGVHNYDNFIDKSNEEKNSIISDLKKDIMSCKVKMNINILVFLAHIYSNQSDILKKTMFHECFEISVNSSNIHDDNLQQDKTSTVISLLKQMEELASKNEKSKIRTIYDIRLN